MSRLKSIAGRASPACRLATVRSDRAASRADTRAMGELMRTANYDTAAKKPPVRSTGPCLGKGVTEIGVVWKLAGYDRAKAGHEESVTVRAVD